MLYGIHRTCTETEVVSCDTSHVKNKNSAVSSPLWWIFKNALCKATANQSHTRLDLSESARTAENGSVWKRSMKMDCHVSHANVSLKLMNSRQWRHVRWTVTPAMSMFHWSSRTADSDVMQERSEQQRKVDVRWSGKTRNNKKLFLFF